MNNLLDRARSPNRLSWRYSVYIFFITAAFHAGGLLVSGIVDPDPLSGMHSSDIGIFVLLVCYFVIPYWGIFLLAVLSDEHNATHRWRVSAAWLLMTCPFAGLYLTLLFKWDSGVGQAFAGITALLIPLSPVVTLVGAVAGFLLFHLHRWHE